MTQYGTSFFLQSAGSQQTRSIGSTSCAMTTRDVPYCVIKGKSRLGQLVHQKTSAVIAFTSVRQEDKGELDTLANTFKAQFNDNAELRRRWGGGINGIKSQHVMARREKAIQLEQAKKLGLSIA